MSAVMEAREPSAKYLSALQPPLVRHFELMATAPDGVAKLRELILTLAVQGKLVPQDPKDEPASELLKRIRAEKGRLIAEGKIKREKPLVEIVEKDAPFTLPKGWEWVQLGEIGLVGSSSRVHQSDWKESGVPFYRAREIVKLSKDGHVSNELFISEALFASLTLSGWVPEENDIMITGVGTIGIPYVVRPTDRFYFKDASVLIFKNYGRLNAQWLTWLMRSPLWIDGIHEHSMGTTVDTLTISRANIALLPLPPANEQARIVTRVEELMRLCDALEAKGQLEAAQHAQLVQALLGALTASTTPEELADNWQRVATHFDRLLDRPEAIDALEQTILQLAVRGLLVPQDPNDEPASELLKKIRAEKDRHVADGKIKRSKPLPPIEEEEQPFGLPVGWEWVRIADLCSMVTDGEHLTPTRCEDPTQVRLVTAKNVRHEVMDYRVTDYVPQDVAEKCWQRCKPEVGDILMVSVGATLGRLCVLREPLDMVLVRSVTVLRPVHLGVLVDYLAFHLMSIDSQREIWSEVKQSAQPCLYLAKSAALKIALPPLSEQSRIVAHVESLRRLGADLRQRLAARQTTQAHLAEALIDEVA